MRTDLTLRDVVQYAAQRSVEVKNASDSRNTLSARQSLGYLGIPEAKIDSAAKAVRQGIISPEQATNMLIEGTYSPLSRMKNLPDGATLALKELDIPEFIAQTDIFGTKNLNPFRSLLAPITAAILGVPAYVLGRRFVGARNITKMLADTLPSSAKAPVGGGGGGGGGGGRKIKTPAHTSSPNDQPVSLSDLLSPTSTHTPQQIAKILKENRDIYEGMLSANFKQIFNKEQPKWFRQAQTMLESIYAKDPTLARNARRQALIPAIVAGLVPTTLYEWFHPHSYRHGYPQFKEIFEANKQNKK